MYAIDKNLAFVILIGGKSKRFGSDKGLHYINEKPIIVHIIEKLSFFKKKKIFIAAHDHTQVQTYKERINSINTFQFILDDSRILLDPSVRSPLVGFYSAFKRLKEERYEKVFIISCDMPLINHEVIKHLINQSREYDCCIPRWESGYIEPLFSIYPVEKGLKNAKFNLKNGIYKLTNLLDKNWRINFVSIEKSIKPLDPNLLTFTNINNKEDILKLSEDIWKQDI